MHRFWQITRTRYETCIRSWHDIYSMTQPKTRLDIERNLKFCSKAIHTLKQLDLLANLALRMFDTGTHIFRLSVSSNFHTKSSCVYSFLHCPCSCPAFHLIRANCLTTLDAFLVVLATKRIFYRILTPTHSAFSYVSFLSSLSLSAHCFISFFAPSSPQLKRPFIN